MRAEVARSRVGWFGVGFVTGAVGMFLAVAKVWSEESALLRRGQP